MKKLSLLFIASLFICAAQGQVRTPTLYVSGTVLSDEKMLVSVLGTKTIEGNVVSAELNGKKTETKTDSKGQALLDFSAISAGLAGQGVAVIKTVDKNGNLLGTANTIVQNGTPSLARPVIDPLPANLPAGETVTIPGKNLGADAQLVCGDKPQQTLSASDKEMTVFTNAKPGEQSAYVTTPNGVSESQMVNIYSLDFALPKNSIKPKENVQAQVHYESIPEGTKLIFTNKSPETIKMTIPGAQNAANECIYTVADKNGSIPVNITGIIRGDFTIALDYDFKNEKKDSIPQVFYDEKAQPPAQPPVPPQPPAPAQPPTLADTLKRKEDVIKWLDGISELLDGVAGKDEEGKTTKTDGVLAKLNAAITKEAGIIASEQSILDDRRFSNVVSGDPSYDQSGKNPGNMQNARENIKLALVQENIALGNKKKAATELDKLHILIPKLKARISRAKAAEITAEEFKNGTKAEQEKAKIAKSDAETNEKEALKELEGALTSLNKIKRMIEEADVYTNSAIELKNTALTNINAYLNTPKSKKDETKAEGYRDILEKSRNDLVDDEKALQGLLGEIDKMQKLGESAKGKEGLGGIVKK